MTERMSLEEYRRHHGLPDIEPAPNLATVPVVQSDPPEFLRKLMELPDLRAALKNEQLLSFEVANMLRQATLDGRYRGVWTHIANEGKRTKLVGAVLKAMGLIPGAFDFVFVWPNGGGLIELKCPPFRPSDLNPNQKRYQQWCIERAVNHAVCTTTDEVWQTLVRWGAASDRRHSFEVT